MAFGVKLNLLKTIQVSVRRDLVRLTLVLDWSLPIDDSVDCSKFTLSKS